VLAAAHLANELAEAAALRPEPLQLLLAPVSRRGGISPATIIRRQIW
jgi:hypothetical protein